MCRGVRAGRAAGIATFMVGIGFGVLAGRAIGIPAAVVMSFVVYAGSAQLAALGVLAAGGSIAAAAIAGLLMNARFIPMGIAAASAYRGGRLRRAVEAQTLVDASWAMWADPVHRSTCCESGWLVGTCRVGLPPASNGADA
jgi:predicted branched-subunit amino acid permease